MIPNNLSNICFRTLIICLLILISKNINSQTWTDFILNYGFINPQCVSTIDDNCCWICSASGPLVLRTTNGGYNFDEVGQGHFDIDSLHVTNIFAFNKYNAIVIAGYYDSLNIGHDYLYRTSNAGQNWISVLTQTQGYFDAIHFKDSLNGFLVADPRGGRWGFWKTTNAGFTWDSSGLYLPGDSTIGSFDRDLDGNGDSLWFGTNQSRVYYSYDWGKHWNFSSAGCPLTFTLTMSGNVGFAAESCIFKTTNAGVNWAQTFLPHSYVVEATAHLDNYFWYSFTDSIYYSSDGGNNFVFQHSLPTLDFIWGISMKKINNNIVGWAVAQNNHIAKYTAPIGIELISSEVPNKYNLYQNYPNPFNPTTKIKYQIAKSSDVKLIIYDITGKEVDILVNEKQSLGIYEVDFNGSNCASGVYFYKLETETFSETKKMVLVK